MPPTLRLKALKELQKAQSLGKDDVIKKTKLNTPAEDAEAIKDIMSRRGTGTILDLPISLIRSLPPVKKRLDDEKYKNLLYSYQKRLIDADKAGGEALANKNKVLKSIFSSKDLKPKTHVVTESGKKVDAFVPTDTARLSAPVDKVKNFAVPTLALYGVGSIVGDNKSSSSERKREGEIVVQKEANSQYEDLKAKLIEKIAKNVATLNKTAGTEEQPSIQKIAKEKIEKAAELLKTASYRIDTLEEKVSELTDDNERLQIQLLAKERSNRAVKLAREMATKGMIKHAEIDTQVDYIMGLNDESYNVLKNTVDSVHVKKAKQGSVGVDKISHIVEDPYNPVSEKPSLAETIMNMSKGIK